MHPKRCRIACMSTDLYMHSVYYSMMLLEGTNYDSYFPCTPEGTNYDFYCPPGSIVKVCTAKNFLIRYSSLPKSSVTDVFSELNQNRSSIGAVSDQYTHICIRPV